MISERKKFLFNFFEVFEAFVNPNGSKIHGKKFIFVFKTNLRSIKMHINKILNWYRNNKRNKTRNVGVT